MSTDTASSQARRRREERGIVADGQMHRGARGGRVKNRAINSNSFTGGL
jgi:hypothetical protein